MIAIIDYGVGNLFSLASSLKSLGLETEVTRDAAAIRAADHIILPGVGAFADAMAKLEATGLVPVIKQEVEHKPLLGICLGMQLLFEKSYEYGEHTGLGLIPGEVCPLADDLKDPSLKVPHIGWNRLDLVPGREDDPLFKYTKPGECVLCTQLLRQKLCRQHAGHQRVQHPGNGRCEKRPGIWHTVPPRKIRRYRPAHAAGLCRIVRCSHEVISCH